MNTQTDNSSLAVDLAYTAVVMIGAYVVIRTIETKVISKGVNRLKQLRNKEEKPA